LICQVFRVSILFHNSTQTVMLCQWIDAAASG
jgi:hypothetical protein